MSWLAALALVLVGVFVGVLLMALMSMARDPSEIESACSKDCNQGRNCTCAK